MEQIIRVMKLLNDKRIHEINNIPVLIFCFCVYVVFLTSIFLFRGLFIISSEDVFRRNLPIQRYLPNGNFHNCLPTE